MLIFFDTSAFVKRYFGEAGTDAVLEWCDRASEIGLSELRCPKSFRPFAGYAVGPGSTTRNIGN